MARRPLRVLALGAALVALLAGGCGGGDGEKPLDESLGFLPKEAPLVVSVKTDLKGRQARSAARILDRFPFSERLLEGVQEGLLGDVDFERQVEPLLGNELVVARSDARSLVDGGKRDFVAAIKAPSEQRLEQAIERGGAEARGERSGAKLYEDSDGDTFAVRDDVLVLAGSRELLVDALARREADDGLEQKDFDDATKGVDENGVVRAYVDVQRALASSSGARAALRVKWVRALRKLGLSASVKDERVDVRFRLATDPEGLSDEDLPIATGDESPSVVDGAGEIGVGIRDPAQIVGFLERALRAVDPQGFGQYGLLKRAIERQAGVDVDEDVLGQLENDLSIGVSLDGEFGARAAVKDPAAFKRTLDRLGKVISELAERLGGQPIGYAPPKRGDDFYALATPGGDTINYGVVNGVFVVANDAARAGRLAKETPSGVDGAKGAIAVSADAERLARSLIGDLDLDLGPLGEIGGRVVSRPLEEARGSVSASAEGLQGRLSLTLDPP